MYMINTLPNNVTIDVMPTAAPTLCGESAVRPRTAPLSVIGLGSTSAFVHAVRTIDAKPAAPPRGRFR